MPSDFGYPFDNSTADLVFRSSDDVDFHVHKAILGMASSFFQNFPYDQPAEKHARTGMPIVPFPEDQKAVEHLLRMVYPVDPPSAANLGEMCLILEVGQKYEVDVVAERVTEWLLSDCYLYDPSASFAVTVYRIACDYGLERVARTAARTALSLSTDQIRAERMHLSNEDYQRLLDYHVVCGEVAAQPYMFNRRDSRDKSAWTGIWMTCQTPGCSKDSRYYIYAKGKLFASVWWVRYLDQAREALRVRPHLDEVTRPALVLQAMKEASSCETCGPHAEKDLEEFAAYFQNLVGSRISGVRLKF